MLLAGIIIGGFLVARFHHNLVQSPETDKLGTMKIHGKVIGFPFSNKWILNHPFYITKRFGEEVCNSWKLLRNVAHVLRKEGYLADIKTPLSVFGDSRPLAVSAGLGSWGKNGLVVNPHGWSNQLIGKRPPGFKQAA